MASRLPNLQATGSYLEVVSNPHCELRLAEGGAAAVGGESQVFPFPVEQRAPRPVEVDREAERKRLEADAVRSARIHQPQSVDARRRSEHRRLAADALRVADDRGVRVGAVRQPLERLPVEVPAAHVREEHAADAAKDAERREHRFDERETQLGVQERRLRTEELEVFVTAHFRVAAEIHEVGCVTPALESAGAERQQA